ncbi:hypothetical protein HHI36_017030 [Cryptolaemus montrouzieri]|uniref:Uncharacterized protein n=1 Tax=Cryptolaemus montrouzieri TaxID=559131 RepID=A0ABD2NMF0_9CUCU
MRVISSMFSIQNIFPVFGLTFIKNNPYIFKPEDYGWVLNSNKYVLNWFEGDQLSKFVSDVIQTPSGVQGNESGESYDCENDGNNGYDDDNDENEDD